MANHKNIIERLEQMKSLLQGNTEFNEELLEALDVLLGKLIKETRPTLLTKEKNLPTNSKIEIWSDGACTGNPGPGGWGTIVSTNGEKKEYSGGKKRTTNNIMEMTGALEGIKKTPAGSSIVVTSDSQYLVKGMTQWMKNWKRKGWKKADGGAVLNRELWIELDHESQKRNIQWVWVRGHAGHPENERCDRLARDAISHQ